MGVAVRNYKIVNCSRYLKYSVLALSVLVNRDGNGWIRDPMKSLILADTKVIIKELSAIADCKTSGLSLTCFNECIKRYLQVNPCLLTA